MVQTVLCRGRKRVRLSGRTSLHHFARFERVDEWLTRTAGLWRPRPFVESNLSWEKALPGLSFALRSLELEDACFLEERPALLARRVPEAADLVETNRVLSEWPALECCGCPELPVHPPRFVSRRKWNQIAAFVRVVLGHVPRDVEVWVDWCAGKGHLGRALASATSRRALGVERERRLCDSGRALAREERAEVDFRCADVLAQSCDDVLGTHAAAVALHACGDLHVKLITSAVEKKAPLIAVAPCCYQHIDADYYQPLSAAARRSGLRLHRHDLRLATLQEVVAGRGERQLRKRAEAYRLSFGFLAEEAGAGREGGFGRVPRSFFRLPFDEFAQRVAKQQGLLLPRRWDPEEFERAGWERIRTATALSIVRGLFRRTIESWLLLDRALFLEERGYAAQIGSFCESTTTPRNLMLLATSARCR